MSRRPREHARWSSRCTLHCVSSLLRDTSNFHAWQVATGVNQQGNVTYANVGLWNQTFVRTVDAGQYDIAVLIDPSALTACCGMNGSLAVYVQLADMTVSGLADPVLLTGVNDPPTMSSFAAIDVGSWQSRSSVHELVFVTQGRALQYVTVANGRYAEDRLSYALYVEVISGAECPPAIANCSNHGVCAQAKCTCDNGWEGLACAIPAAVLVNATSVVSPMLSPGEWAFYVYPLSDVPPAIVEVDLVMTQVSSGLLARPLLTAFFDSARSATSLAGLQSEHALFDFNGFSSQARIGAAVQQRVVALRTNARSERVLYVGVSNSVQARSPVSVSVALVALSSYTTPPCTGTACRSTYCASHGDVSVINGQPTCICDVGWNPENNCAGPLLVKFDTLIAAAQSITFLCSVCAVASVPLDRSGMAFYKVPQPLQASTGLQVTVRPASGVVAASGGSRRRLVGADARTLASNASINSNVGVLGTPTLLVSTSLPRR